MTLENFLDNFILKSKQAKFLCLLPALNLFSEQIQSPDAIVRLYCKYFEDSDYSDELFRPKLTFLKSLMKNFSESDLTKVFAAIAKAFVDAHYNNQTSYVKKLDEFISDSFSKSEFCNFI